MYKIIIEMGFNVADQFRKWKRNSTQRELPLENGVYRQNFEEPVTVSTATTPPPPQQPPQQPTVAVIADPSQPNKNVPKKLRKPPVKQYPPSPDTYLNGIGDYTFVRQVGQGKFSRVMLSYHCLTRKQVAVKVKKKKIFFLFVGKKVKNNNVGI